VRKAWILVIFVILFFTSKKEISEMIMLGIKDFQQKRFGELK